jgi:endogenous inhibitor of DNA gyrase (YacG/DUF329 family)
MYCPKCGQQQINDSTRFCSRCGLQISELAQWLAGGGTLALNEEATPPEGVSPKRKGVRRGAKLIFFSVVLFPIFLGLSIAVDEPGPLLLPFTVFLAGLTYLLYHLIFSEQTAPTKTRQTQPARLAPGFGPNALPPGSTVWANNVSADAVRTSELAQPPSVTENTTKLLDKD